MRSFLVDEHCVFDMQTLVLLSDERVELRVGLDVFAVVDGAVASGL